MDMDKSKLQALMNQAYARWQAQPEDGTQWSLKQFWAQLNEEERLAVFVGNFNQQVENGGWFQWWDNGYCTNETGAYLFTLCEQMGTETSHKVRNMLRRWSTALPDERESQRLSIYDHDGEDEQDQRDALFELSNELSDAYYEINGAWLEEVESALADGIVAKLSVAGNTPMVPVPASEGVRYPHITVKLVGQDSNAFNIIGLVHQAMKRRKVSAKELEAFDAEARSGDYDNVLITCMKWVNVT